MLSVHEDSLNRLANHTSALEVLDSTLNGHILAQPWRARAAALRAIVLYSSNSIADAEAAAIAAEAEARRVGDRVATAYALHALSLVRNRQGRAPVAAQAAVGRR
jgi:hypothetical protein